MKQVNLLVLLISLLCIQGVNSHASNLNVPYAANTCPSESKPAGGNGGDFTPFPWGNEIPISHTTLQGIWAPTAIECGTFFFFEMTIIGPHAQRIVNVKQFDPETCTILSSGVGYELEKVFYVSMVGQNGRAYDLTVRAFNRKDLKPKSDNSGDQIDIPISRRPLIVATLYPQREWSKRISYPLVKASSSNHFECSNGDALPQGR